MKNIEALGPEFGKIVGDSIAGILTNTLKVEDLFAKIEERVNEIEKQKQLQATQEEAAKLNESNDADNA